MNDMLQEAVHYFKKERRFHRLFVQFRKKVESLGHAGGNVNTSLLSKKELEAIALFYGLSPDDMAAKKSISLLQFERKLQSLRFEGVTLMPLLEAYFGEEIRSKRSIQLLIAENQEKKLRQAADQFPVLSNYVEHLLKGSSDTFWVKRLAEQPDFEETMATLAAGLAGLPETLERLPFFSQRTTGNPHTFDPSSICGRLFLHALQVQSGYAGASPSAEHTNELLLSVRVLRDDIANFVTFANLTGFVKGVPHPVWQAAVDTCSAVNMPLRELLKIDKVEHASKHVFVVENSSVFSSLLDAVPQAALVCMHGQFKLAGLRLIDLLAESDHNLHYSGDLDPEGLTMLYRLQKRHPFHVKQWLMDVPSYERSLSDVDISDRLSKLSAITDPEQQEVIRKMKEYGKAGYQEALLEEMIADLRKAMNE